MATANEQLGLQRAIAKALEKENERIPHMQLRYEAKMYIGKEIKTVTSTDLDAFVQAVKGLRTSFPNLPIYVFEIKEYKA
jgi:hypothetical protein